MHHHNEHACGQHVRAHHDMFGKHGFKMPSGMAAHPHGFGGPGMRARRGDVRAAVLRLLSEKPMHGYQIIQELAARSGGAWSPSAGSVYPTLQMLADEGLVTAEESSGKKVFSLTDSGIAAVEDSAEQPAPWEEVAQGLSGLGEYREAVARLMQAAFQIGKSGTTEQRGSAIEILVDARKKLYAILAQD